MKKNEFYDNLIHKLGEANFKKVQEARVGIAGLGGLGSNCALNLVRVGFKRLTIVDFDTVTNSNLDRQFYFLDQVGRGKTDSLAANLRRVNPDLELKEVNRKIEKTNVAEIFGDCDVVAECFDRAEYKSMLVAALLALGKFTVSASGLGGCGESDEIKTHRIKRGLIVIGDLTSDICKRPAISPRVNIAAAKQADAILEYVMTR